MAQNSKIEWTHHTANLWHGCKEVHEGCDNCYARVLNNRWGKSNWGNDVPRLEVKSVWKELDKFQKLAKEKNEIHRVFVGSMMDIFEKSMSMIDSNGEPVPCVGLKQMNTGLTRDILFQNITNGWYPNLMFLLLTKRPSNINKYIPEKWKENPPTNVMFGTSPVNQETANKLIKQLKEVNGKKFLSIEPQLGTVNLLAGLDELLIDGIDWVIQGGESGHHKRPFNLDWAYQMKADCQSRNVPYFFKQIDKIKEIPTDLMIREFPICIA
jgi:protein gp37